MTHRALADAETCARVLCALFPRLCAHAGTIGEALALLRAAAGPAPARGRDRRRGAPRGARRRLPDCRRPARRARASTSSATPRARCSTSASRSRPHARAGALPASRPPRALGRAGRDGRLRDDALGARALAARGPADPPLRRRATCASSTSTATSTCAAASTSRSRSSRSPPRPRAGLGVSVGPLRGRAPAVELLEQLNSLFGLRHCGRKLPRRDCPSAYGQMGRCLSPCLGDLDPNLYRRRLDEALGAVHRRAATAGPRCSPTSTTRCARPRAGSSSARAGCAAAASGWPAARRPRRGGRRDARAAAARAGRAPARRRASTPCGSWAGASSTGATAPRTSTTSGAARRRPCATTGARRDGVPDARRRRRGAARLDVAGARRGGRRGHPRPAPGASAGAPAGFLARAARPRRRAPLAAGRVEGQRDDLGGRPAVAAARVARLGLAAHDGQADRPEAVGDDAARRAARPRGRRGAAASRRPAASLRRRPRRWRFGLPR